MKNKNLEYLRKIDPFKISIEEFCQLNIEEINLLLDKIYNLCEREIMSSFKESEYIIICDRKVVFKTDNYDKLEEKYREFLESTGKPCYCFCKSIEEMKIFGKFVDKYFNGYDYPIEN
jgi:hypothetical protein